MKKVVIIKIDKNKLRTIVPTTNPFLSLARSIIYQQISTAAGNSIHAKFLILFGKKKASPQNFLKLSIAELRSAGISPQKALYLKDLADKFIDKTINSKNFHNMTDEEVKEHLMQVKGIGSWTADMFLIFALNRPNILPTGDLAIAKAFQKVFKLRKIPSVSQMEKLAQVYMGNHTELSLYLWSTLDAVTIDKDDQWAN